MNKYTIALIFFGLIIIFNTSIIFAQKRTITCSRSNKTVGIGSTFFLSNEGKLKGLNGQAMFPNGEAAEVVIEIYKNPFKDNSKTDSKEVNSIVEGKTKIAGCKSDKNGNFNILGLPNGRYLLRIGVVGIYGGFGPENVLIEISNKIRRVKKIKINLGAAF